ncbi:MAG: hypothetical protein Kow0076_4570 [Francisella sp.]
MKKIFLFAFLCFFLVGCSSTEPSYLSNSVGQVSQVEQGKVVDIQQVSIKGSSNIGSRIGGVAGGIGGALAGSGNIFTQLAASIGGAIVGGIAGGFTESAITSSKGYQFTIKLNNGKSIAVLQKEKLDINIGDKVTVYMSGNNTRVVPAQ